MIINELIIISSEIIKFLRRKTELRRNILIVSSIFTGIFVLLMFFSPFILYSSFFGYKFPFLEVYFNEIKLILLFATFVSLYFVSIAIISYTSFEMKFGGFEVELKDILNERGEIKKKVFEQPLPTAQTDVLNTIELNLNHLNEYYVINKNQAKSSYRTSLFSIFIGLVTLISGIWIFYLQDTPNLQLTALSSISAIIIETIGGLYFVIYKKSLDQLNYFYEKLYQIQNVMLAIKLNSDIQNEDKKIENLEKIIISLLPSTKEK